MYCYKIIQLLMITQHARIASSLPQYPGYPIIPMIGYAPPAHPMAVFGSPAGMPAVVMPYREKKRKKHRKVYSLSKESRSSSSYSDTSSDESNESGLKVYYRNGARQHPMKHKYHKEKQKNHRKKILRHHGKRDKRKLKRKRPSTLLSSLENYKPIKSMKIKN